MLKGVMEDEMRFRDCLCFQLGKASRKMAKFYRMRLAPYGLTHNQFFLLIALYEGEGLSVSELADKVALDKATMTGLLDRMERDDLIRREKDSTDRRTYRIYLTERAEALREDMMRIYREVNGLFLSCLWPGERRVLERIMAKIEALAEEGMMDEGGKT